MKLDIDTLLLLSLPLLAGILLIFLPEEAIFFTLLLMLSLMSYIVIVYPKREIYGFSGIKILTIPSVVLLAYTIIIAAPAIYICHIKDTPAIYPYFFTVCGFYIIIALGYRLGDKIWPIDVSRAKTIQPQSFRKSPVDPIIAELLWALLIVGLGIYALYVLQLKKIPIIELFTDPGDAVKFSILREESLKLLKVPTYVKYLVQWQRSLLMPFGILTSLFLYLTYRRKRYLWLFIIFFIVGLTFNSLTLEKAPTGAILMAIMGVLFLRKKSFSLRFSVISILTFFVLPIFIMYMKYREEDDKIVDILVKLLVERIIVVPSQMLYEHFVIFPEKVDFLLGRSSQLFSWMHIRESIQLPALVAKIYYKNPDTDVYLNAIYLANFWADFGTVGIVLSTFAAGILLHWIMYKIFVITDYQKSILLVSTIAIGLPYFTIQFLSANITTIFFSQGFLLIILFLILVYQIYRFTPALRRSAY